MSDKLWPFSNKDQLSRYAAFIEATYECEQIDLLEDISGYYPLDTQFVVLAMDMAFQGAGRVPVPLEQQLQDLVKVRQDDAWKHKLLPFVPVDPRRAEVLDLVKRYVEEHGFVGVKLYPALGYWACDPRLFPVYAYCEEKQIPITTHASRGGVYFKGKLPGDGNTYPNLLKHPIT
ncbi:MAG: amidohydrolase family protein, partial [Verrucomicrobiota bacterium]